MMMWNPFSRPRENQPHRPDELFPVQGEPHGQPPQIPPLPADADAHDPGQPYAPQHPAQPPHEPPPSQPHAGQPQPPAPHEQPSIPHADACRPMPMGPIAEIEMMGQTAVATLTLTELSQEQGAEQLAELLHELGETGAMHFILDVQNVQYMDTACLGCLVEALNRLSARGGKIALVNPNQSVHYVFRLTRLDRVFRMCPDVVSALEAVEGRMAG
jgi:anti-sigma B factor antagonist